MREKETEETDGGGDRADVKDPRKSLADILKDGILSCVLPKHMSVSECRLEEKVNASENRMWCPQVTSFEDAAAVAEYLNEMNMAPKAVSKAEEGVIAVIVNEYILRHFKQAAVKTSDYACDDFKTQLQYENEYIICGHETDRDNLLDTINRVVLIRTVFNIAYLFTDAVKKARDSYCGGSADNTIAIFRAGRLCAYHGCMGVCRGCCGCEKSYGQGDGAAV